jgi:hypothetical protein
MIFFKSDGWKWCCYVLLLHLLSQTEIKDALFLKRHITKAYWGIVYEPPYSSVTVSILVCRWVKSFTQRPLCSREKYPDAGWLSEPVFFFNLWLRASNLPPSETNVTVTELPQATLTHSIEKTMTAQCKLSVSLSGLLVWVPHLSG